jgi:hypothetical protein
MASSSVLIIASSEFCLPWMAVWAFLLRFSFLVTLLVFFLPFSLSPFLPFSLSAPCLIAELFPNYLAHLGPFVYKKLSRGHLHPKLFAMLGLS